MSIDLSRFRHAIQSMSVSTADHPKLLIERDGRLACHYAPFESINCTAKVVLVGITPGRRQACNALDALRAALFRGVGDGDALVEAKRMASFSGNMRGNLIALMDRIGLHERLVIDSCRRLFSDRGDLVHFTSALRNPVFIDGKDYSGNPSILCVPMLARMSERWLGDEIDQIPEAVWVPLGKEPTLVLKHFVARGRLRASQLLDGLPHPSGANAERIAYFLGTKPRGLLSSKTDADGLDSRLATLQKRLGGKSVGGEVHRRGAEGAPLQSRSMQQPPVTTVASRPRTGRVAGSASVAQAEAIIVRGLSRIKPASKKVAGFQTVCGRHLALQRDVQGIQVWTEDLDPPESIAPCELYEAHRSRHSNLASHAPRVATGRPARKWRLENVMQLEALISWYANA